jgi:hypothetical protein
MRPQAERKKKLLSKPLIVFIVILLSGFYLRAQPGGPVDPIDLCMRLADPTTNQVEIVMRPTVNLLPTENITEIRFTVWWKQPLVNITLGPLIDPFNVQLVPGGPVPNGGFYYQTFQKLSDDFLGFPVSAGQEVVIATFTVSAPLWTFLYISDDAYIMSKNIQYYYELDGQDRTGIIYCDNIQITPDLSVPVSNWPIYMAILLMAGTVAVFMIRKLW